MPFPHSLYTFLLFLMSTETGIVILDDSTSNITFGERPWDPVELPQWYNGITQFPSWAGDVNTNLTANFNMTFEGTSIAFIGNTPPRSTSQTAMISIDGAAPYESGFEDPDPQSYIQWYQSPMLPDGQHSISMSQLGPVALDIALVTVGPNTPLSGRTLYIDNEDAQIEYSGRWTRGTDKFIPVGLPDGFPVRNTTHQTSDVGDTMTFRFSGTAVSIYGIFDWGVIGRLGTTYNLDGSTVQRSYIVTENSKERTTGEWSNFVYYSKQGLSDGPHILVVSITEALNLKYMLDYITYVPSFPNLSSRPDLSNLTIPDASGTPNPVPTFTPSGANLPAGSGSNATRGETPVGAIVGGVIGSLALLFFLFVFLWFRRNIQYIKQREEDQPHVAEVGMSTNVFRSPVQISDFPSLVSRGVGAVSPFPFTPAAPLHTTIFAGIRPESKFSRVSAQEASDIAMQSNLSQAVSSNSNSQLSYVPQRSNSSAPDVASPPAYDPDVPIISDAPRGFTRR